ncbi:hypothetical protein EVAR_12412_1 [Eumeta japonica]|uniref:Uncharacterized protein n=1 Tax=Eumeta variegata TaxID=151549 RepID=A0A4C1TZ63_EUMVA|nr:hypothetical protein EVAR_12412_1 [Eumeta japonica]
MRAGKPQTDTAGSFRPDYECWGAVLRLIYIRRLLRGSITATASYYALKLYNKGNAAFTIRAGGRMEGAQKLRCEGNFMLISDVRPMRNPILMDDTAAMNQCRIQILAPIAAGNDFLYVHTKRDQEQNELLKIFYKIVWKDMTAPLFKDLEKSYLTYVELKIAKPSD